MKKILFSILIILLSWNVGMSQQYPAISQYMFNQLYLNPASAGTHDYFTTSIVSRHQWTTFEGAPQTALLAVDGKIEAENMGLGLLVSNDRLGVVSNTEFYGVYSFMVQIDKRNKLSFGVKAGASNYREHNDELTYWDQDPVFDDDFESSWYPKAGFGVYFFNERFYAGISIPTLLAYDSRRDFSLDVEKASFFDRHYLFSSGYVFHISENLDLKPFTMIKYNDAAPLQADLNLTALIKKRLWLGVGYRTSTAWTGIVEFQINHMIRVGYSYDFLHADLYKYAGGTHEFMVGLDFGENLRKIKNIRYF